MVVNFDAPTEKVKSPTSLAHVVLRTSNFKPMVEFYKKFLGAKPAYENEFISFLTYDEEHHRIAIGNVPGTEPKVATSCGLEHIAFTFDSLEDLALAYRQRKRLGIEPMWSVNHGPTTSIYYMDPDGNQLETQVDNFSSPDDATKFMMSKEFGENPIGTDFDPEDLIRRLEASEDDQAIKTRVESGPRGLPDFIVNPGKINNTSSVIA